MTQTARMPIVIENVVATDTWLWLWVTTQPDENQFATIWAWVCCGETRQKLL